MTSPIVEIIDVDLSLGGQPILSDINLTVNEGDLIGLIGPNGAGKSTLIRTINAVLQPDEGSVVVGGVDVHTHAAKSVSQLVATVPQNTTIAFDFSVREVVEMGRTPYQRRVGSNDRFGHDRIRSAMVKTDTLQFTDRSIDSLSGGERQRVILARAIAQDTPVLLLDEPTANLDINHQVQAFELVQELVESEQKTVIAAIHDLNLAAHYCDALVLLASGRILATGEPKDVLQEPNLNTAFDTRAVVTRHPVTGSVAVTALPERQSRETQSRIHVIGGGGTASRILYLLNAAGYEVTVGALHFGDSDLATAQSLGLETITVPPFSVVEESTASEVRAAIRRSDLTVLADFEVGSGNIQNLAAAEASEKLVIVEERPFDERNYIGRRATMLYNNLLDSAVVTEENDLLDLAESLLGSYGDAGGGGAENHRNYRSSLTTDGEGKSS